MYLYKITEQSGSLAYVQDGWSVEKLVMLQGQEEKT